MDWFEWHAIHTVADHFWRVAVNHALDVGVLVVEGGVQEPFEKTWGRIGVHRGGIDDIVCDDITV